MEALVWCISQIHLFFYSGLPDSVSAIRPVTEEHVHVNVYSWFCAASVYINILYSVLVCIVCQLTDLFCRFPLYIVCVLSTYCAFRVYYPLTVFGCIIQFLFVLCVLSTYCILWVHYPTVCCGCIIHLLCVVLILSTYYILWVYYPLTVCCWCIIHLLCVVFVLSTFVCFVCIVYWCL